MLLLLKYFYLFYCGKHNKGETMTNKNISIKSTYFIFIISAYFAFCLNNTFWQFAYNNINIENFRTFLFALSLPIFMFIPLFVLFNIITLPYISKPLITILLICSASANYAMHNLGTIINSDMIQNFAETTYREASELITLKAITYVFITGILPAIITCFIKIQYSNFKKELISRLAIILICLIGFGILSIFSYKDYISFARNHSQVRRYINTFNYISGINKYYKRQKNAQREFTIYDSSPSLTKQSSKPRLIILAIGETAREKNFSLYGYEKNTNPLLSKQDIYVFNNVVSCGTSTAVSVPCLFAHQTRETFNANDAKYAQNLLDIAQKAGYNILWKENDDGCKNVCNRVETIDAQKFLNTKHCFDDYCHDEFLLEGLEDKIKDLKKDTLIVLHMMGSHGPTYFKRYPDSFKKFEPFCNTSDLQKCTPEEIINTYNNTILYTDYVLSSLIDILKRQPQIESGMLYVSDHGESLGENNIYLHGLPYSMAPSEQKEIPMILWLSNSLKKQINIDNECLKQNAQKNQHSHDNFYHSVLHLLSINSSTYNSELDIFANCIIKQ